MTERSEGMSGAGEAGANLTDLLARAEALLGRCESMTPGPWVQGNFTDVFTTNRRGDENDGFQVCDCMVDYSSDDDPGLPYEQQRNNADAISTLPNALDLIRELVGAIAVEREACAKVCEQNKWEGFAPPEDGLAGSNGGVRSD